MSPYHCEHCEYTTTDNTNWKKHLMTKKHLKKSGVFQSYPEFFGIFQNFQKVQLKEDNGKLKEDNGKLKEDNGKLKKDKNGKKTKNVTDSSSDEIKLNIIKKENEEKYKCMYCLMTFKRNGSLSQHMNKRCGLKTQLYEKVKLLTNENIHLQKELMNTKEELEDSVIISMDKTMDRVLTIADKGSSTSKTSVDALSYLVQNSKKAPPLKALEKDEVKNILPIEKDYLLEKRILRFYKEGTLSKYIVTLIVMSCKKDNPIEQSMWNTDVTRVSYIIMDIVSDKPTWVRDKKGMMIIERIISPVLDQIRERLIQFGDVLKDMREKAKTVSDFEKIDEAQMMLICVTSLIDDDKRTKDLSNEIIRYMSPEFQLKESDMKKFLECDANILPIINDDTMDKKNIMNKIEKETPLKKKIKIKSI